MDGRLFPVQRRRAAEMGGGEGCREGATGETTLTTGGETSRPGMEEEEGGHPETVGIGED